jgi:D-glycero-D-manno-heptose 1,7-bisphosphate phosphatase
MSYKAVFLDRDDTLIEDPGYISHPSQVKLLPGAAAALAQLRKMDFRLVVVSNQSGVARGIITEETLAQIHHTLEKLLADEGVYLDAIFYCPFHPDGVVPKYRIESDLRKPAPGMLLNAAKELGIELSRSWMIGDSYRDIEAGRRAGCKTILINSPAKPVTKNPTDSEPDRQAVNIREAVNIIRMFERQPQPETGTSKPDVIPPEVKAIDNAATATAPQPEQSAMDIHETVPQPIETEDIAQELPEVELPEKIAPAQASVPIAHSNEEDKKGQHFSSHTETLLLEVLTHLKMAYKLGRDEDFSIWMIIAGACQVLAVGCLVVAMWFFLDSTRPADSTLVMLGFAGVFQLMTLTFFMMRSRS